MVSAKSRPPHSDMPLVTIIMAVWNGEKTIEKAIQSVKNQAYPNIEFIVIDAASTDRTREILKQYEADIDCLISEPDEGVYDAWNKGLSCAKGEWIAFLGADDEYQETAITQYIQAIQASGHKDLQFISSKVELIDHVRQRSKIIGGAWRWNLFRIRMCVAHVGALHHRSLFAAYGLFDKNYKIAGDYEFLLRPRQQLKAAYLDAVTVKMAEGGISGSGQVYREAMRAKHLTGKRNYLLCLLEKTAAVTRFHIRNWLATKAGS